MKVYRSLFAAFCGCLLTISMASAQQTISLSTDVLNEGNPAGLSFAHLYNNNGTDSTVELIRFIPMSNSSPLNVAYTQGVGPTIDLSQYILVGAERGAGQGFKSNGYTDLGGTPGAADNLYLRGQPNQDNEGFGAHANWLITFDLDSVRDVHLNDFNGMLELSGDFGAWGGIGSTDPTAGVIQGAIFLDGVRIDTMLETNANPTAANRSFDLDISSGRWLTFAVLNGDGTADSTLWDDGLFQNVQLTTTPEPSSVALWTLLAIVGLSIAVWRRRR